MDVDIYQECQSFASPVSIPPKCEITTAKAELMREGGESSLQSPPQEKTETIYYDKTYHPEKYHFFFVLLYGFLPLGVPTPKLNRIFKGKHNEINWPCYNFLYSSKGEKKQIQEGKNKNNRPYISSNESLTGCHLRFLALASIFPAQFLEQCRAI